MKKIIYQIIAAFTFFTRVPLWRFVNVPSDYFSHIIYLWPLTGLFTGLVSVLTWVVFSKLTSPLIAIILAICSRILITGGLHEDGLADFFDGFGGGKSKKDTLRIMKDSNTGSYALIGLILYFSLLFSSLYSLPVKLVVPVLLTGNTFSKFLSIIPMNLLPYARNEEESKAKTSFNKLNTIQWLITSCIGISPLIYFFGWNGIVLSILPVISTAILFFVLKNKLNGYTGDTCGASNLISELAFILGVQIYYHLL